MSDFRFELNYKGVGELLNSDEVTKCIEGYASARCPEGCIIDTMKGNRVNVRIVTDTDEAYKDNLNNNTLLKAVQR